MKTAHAEKTSPISGSVNRSYLLLRRWIAIIALLLPVVLWIGDGPWPHASISEYYHNPGGWMRDYLVGTLSAIGFFLYFYKGYSKIEDIVLNLAGVSALLVAFAPMAWACSHCANPRLFPEWSSAPFGLSLHGLSAALLFISIAYICIFRSEETLRLITNEQKRSSFRLRYQLLGVLMVLVPLCIYVSHLLSPKSQPSLVVFWIETAGIVIFALYWLQKSREVALIQRQ